MQFQVARLCVSLNFLDCYGDLIFMHVTCCMTNKRNAFFFFFVKDSECHSTENQLGMGGEALDFIDCYS